MESSLKKHLLRVLSLMAIPLTLLMLASNLYSMGAYNQKLAVSNQLNLELGADTIQKELEAIDTTLITLIAGNSDFALLSGGTSNLQGHLSSLALINQLKMIMPAYSSVSGFFMYSQPSHIERDIFDSTISYPQKQQIRQFVRQCVGTDRITHNMKWKYAKFGESSYLFRFLGGRSNYLVAMVSLEKLVQTNHINPEGDSVFAFISDKYIPLTQSNYITENNIQLYGVNSGYYFTGKPRHMVLDREIHNTDCRLVLLVGSTGYFSSLNPIQLTLLVTSFFAALLAPLLFWWFNRTILVPLNQLKQAIDDIQGGDMDAQIQLEAPVLEFRQISDMFNAMMAQIKRLKIEAYEKELETKQAQLKYLQLQIRPHFFLNCLKSIYALAKQKEYDRQEQMILAFSKHISYIFTEMRQTVPLQKELEHVKNYIEIQSISAVHPLQCTIVLEEGLEKFPIPPISVQTFVENAVKHGTNPDYGLEIEVKAAYLQCEDGVYVDLTVTDNGNGFTPQALKEINQEQNKEYTGQHVGLYNVKRRIQLYYGDEVMFAFFNQDKGAVSEILIPLQLKDIPLALLQRPDDVIFDENS